jgi:NAD(P)-dependent dehydrogenase (short-subunit alcohol dehydrogenase family)
VAPLGGRAALVTGASRGIGRAIATALAAAGARVALVARDDARLAVLAEQLGGGALVLPCDVRDGRQVAAAAARATEALGGAPDVLVNAAGVFALAPIESTDPDEFARAIDANLVGPFRLLREFVGAMRGRGSGHVVTIGSVADEAAFPENGMYAASKFGLRGLHEVLRAELRGSGVRATLVSPGPVDTPLWDDIRPDDRPGFTPRARMLRPEDVADAVLYAVTAPPRVNVDLVRLGPA